MFNRIFGSTFSKTLPWVFGGSRRNPIAVITFDDHNESDLTYAYPKMSEKGWAGTSYIIPSRMAPWDHKMSEAQIVELHNNGWDVQCHSESHGNFTEMTEQEIKDEMTSVNTFFEELNIPLPKHFAYPFGARNDFTDSVVADYRKTYRGTFYSYKSYFPGKLQPLIYGLPMDATTESDYNRTRDWIHKTAKDGKILILYGHRIAETSEGGHLLETYFDGYLDLIEKLGFTVMSVSELYDEFMKE